MTENWNLEVAKEIKKLEFDRKIELLTKSIVDNIKDDIKLNGSKKKRHKQ
jgi:hypothetical protein